MSRIIIHTPFNIELEFQSANVWRRVLAVFTDISLILCYLFLADTLVMEGMALREQASVFGRTIGMAIVPYLYFPLTEILLHGQTPGKKLFSLKVIDLQGNEPSMSQTAVRWLLGFGNYSVFLMSYLRWSEGDFLFNLFITFVAICICYLPDFICSLMTNKAQRIADIAAGTVVIDTRRRSDFSETIYLHVPETEQTVRYPQVMRLSDRDINGIRNLLAKKAASKTELEYRARIVQRICEVLEIGDPEESDEDLLQQLLQDYNLMTRNQQQ
ncbi:RDD family protein [Rurimicrobium arvi]|uniref:RDD domain-containing protein n=1 Tax=Rurimicrobium arvi TaxID=2049916 RepID=A0ABP8MN45_9BACT